MTDADLLAYVGAATGIIGGVTGICGAAMGYISYRRTNEAKALDLRLELKKAGVELFHEIDDMHGLLSIAETSRNNTAAATGQHGSGAHERWTRQLGADRESIHAFDEAFDELNTDHSESAHDELERKIVEVHALKSSLVRMREKYEAGLVRDEKDGDRLRSAMRK